MESGLFFILLVVVLFWASQVALVVKNLPANAGDVRDMGLIPGLGRSLEEGMAPDPCVAVGPGPGMGVPIGADGPHVSPFLL